MPPTVPPPTQPLALPRVEWRARAQAHADRVDVLVEPHLARRRRGEKHPVHDFLFDYYSQRPAALRRWHPGYGTVLLDAPEYAALTPYSPVLRPIVRHEFAADQASRQQTRDGLSVAVGAAVLEERLPLVRTLRELLAATASRPPTLGCLGLHEWAMVHRTAETRHAWPLRLGGAATDAFVEGQRIACSHFDAFRFFTPTARPLNTLTPGRDDRAAYEQPGCLHAGMDLYKHAFRLTPLVPSDLVADAFELAWDIRVLDMRAAPYDFSGVRLDPTGEEWTPVRIETAEGRAAYVAAQRAFSERAAPIRQRLVDECDRLLATAG